MRRLVLFSASVALLSGLAVATAAPARASEAKTSGREEIVVTHKRLAPLSEWAQMQAHEAEYRRLKAKFDPDPAEPPVDIDTADRESMKPPEQRAPSDLQQMQQNGEAPIVKALTQGSP